jgi:Protein of unknown function (DUF2782)
MRLLAVSMLLWAAAAAAQSRVEPPLPEPLPPPPLPEADEPAVEIAVRQDDAIEEIRAGGRVVMLKVTPPGGKPYYLVDTAGSGNWVRREPLDDGVRVPMWPIHTFQ